MPRARKDYAWIATRIDPHGPQNLGDFSIHRCVHGNAVMYYHYNSDTGRLINRNSWAMPVINHDSRIYRECMKAVQRLRAEERMTKRNNGTASNEITGRVTRMTRLKNTKNGNPRWRITFDMDGEIHSYITEPDQADVAAITDNFVGDTARAVLNRYSRITSMEEM